MRKYPIPRAAQAEARKALNWRRQHGRGGTSVGLNTARTLAAGGTIGIEKARHIAKYFPRHEVDKRGTGWTPGDAGFPSNGRIAWALWGGDAAWRWAKQIVERADAAEAMKNRQRTREELKAIFAKKRFGSGPSKSGAAADDTAPDSSSAADDQQPEETSSEPTAPTSPSQSSPDTTDTTADSPPTSASDAEPTAPIESPSDTTDATDATNATEPPSPDSTESEDTADTADNQDEETDAPTSSETAETQGEDSADEDKAMPPSAMEIIEKLASYLEELGKDETPPSEYLSQLDDIQEGRSDFIDASLVIGNPLTSAGVVAGEIAGSDSPASVLAALLPVMPGVRQSGLISKTIAKILKSPGMSILATAGLAEAANQIEDYRTDNPEMSPEEKKGYALIQQALEYGAAYKGIQALKGLTKLYAPALNTLIKNTGQKLGAKFKAWGDAIKNGIGSISPELKTALDKYQNFYDKASDLTGKTVNDIASLGKIPGYRDRLAGYQAKLDMLKSAVNPGGIVTPELQRKIDRAQKMVDLIKGKIKDAATGAGIVAGAVGGKLAYEEYEIGKLQADAKDALSKGETWKYDYTDDRGIGELIVETYFGTYGNALEKQFRTDRYPAETAAYRAQYELIAEAEADGRISSEKAKELRSDLEDDEPFNMAGKSLWTVAPAVSAYLSWKLSEARDAIEARQPGTVGSLRDADTLNSPDFPDGIRFIDYNAPETPKDPSQVSETDPTKRAKKLRGEPLGEEAYTRAQELLQPGQGFRAVTYGDKDKWGRDLGYIETLPRPFDALLKIPGVSDVIPDWMTTDVGATLLEEGYGDTRYRELPGSRPRSRDYDKIRAEAQAAGAGVWSEQYRNNPDLSWVGTSANVPNVSTNMSDLARAIDKAASYGGLGIMVSGNTGIFRSMGQDAARNLVQPWNAAVAVAGSAAQEARQRYLPPVTARPIPDLPTRGQADMQQILDEINRRNR